MFGIIISAFSFSIQIAIVINFVKNNGDSGIPYFQTRIKPLGVEQLTGETGIFPVKVH